MVPIHAMIVSACGRGLHEKADAHQHVNARGHHGRGMDERGDRRRPFHRIRQPNVKWKLGRLPDRAAKDKQRRDREVSGITGNLSEFPGHFLKDNGTGRRPRHQDSEHETEIPEAIRDEGLLRCLGCGVTLEPVADQQIGTHADEFPENKHHDKIVRKDDAEHREHEEGERSEVRDLPASSFM